MHLQIYLLVCFLVAGTGKDAQSEILAVSVQRELHDFQPRRLSTKPRRCFPLKALRNPERFPFAVIHLLCLHQVSC